VDFPNGWFARCLIGGWGVFFVATLFVFLFPNYVAVLLIRSLWILSICVILATFAYASASVSSMFGRLFGIVRGKFK
jgi:hypothetical protein